MKTIGIVGSRRRDTDEDYSLTISALSKIYKNGDKLVSGGCPLGGDRFCEKIARTCEIPITIHRADWKAYGSAAGFIRNTDIARDADILIAVVASDRKGGTEDTIKKFKGFHPEGTIILV